jgi:very-short-patch-repair endonuclease
VLELDSEPWHTSRWAFERDRRKTATLTAAGLTVMRDSGQALHEQPIALIARIAQALTHRAAA